MRSVARASKKISQQILIGLSPWVAQFGRLGHE
jgi:hypothetical protein